MQPQFQYLATVVGIHDGDTITVDVDCGFRITYRTPLRFYGINAPELATQAGKDALTYLKTLIAVGDQIIIKTFKVPGDKYGRYLAIIYDKNGMNVNQNMVDSGHAIPYLVS